MPPFMLPFEEWRVADLAAYHRVDPRDMRLALERALWAGDTDTLDELAHCRCCCHEHTFEDCLAPLWVA